jgi:hypothetical protein
MHTMTVEELLADMPGTERHEEKRVDVKLTDKAKPILVGSETKYPGDTISVRFQQARELVEAGLAVLTDLVGVVFPPARKKPPTPAPAPRLDEPGPGRSHKVQVLRGKSVWLGGDRSYGDDEILYVSEEHARLLCTARKIKLIDPPGLPAECLPARPSAALPIGKYGTAMLGLDPLERANDSIRA